MKMLKNLLRHKAVYGGLLAAALVVLVFSGVQTSRAALTYISEYYSAHVDLYRIGVSLMENGQRISHRDYTSGNTWDVANGELLKNMYDEAAGESLQVGKVYEEKLWVENSGYIPEYVRVMVYRYWEKDGQKQTTLDPDLIDLHFVEGEWILDESASTPERTVLYWPAILEPGASTSLFADTIRIDDFMVSKVRQEETTGENGETIIRTVYDYDGLEFVLEAEVDAVQTHNAEDAIKSAWGVNVSIGGDGSLSLN